MLSSHSSIANEHGFTSRKNCPDLSFNALAVSPAPLEPFPDVYTAMGACTQAFCLTGQAICCLVAKTAKVNMSTHNNGCLSKIARHHFGNNNHANTDGKV